MNNVNNIIINKQNYYKKRCHTKIKDILANFIFNPK